MEFYPACELLGIKPDSEVTFHRFLELFLILCLANFSPLAVTVSST